MNDNIKLLNKQRIAAKLVYGSWPGMVLANHIDIWCKFIKFVMVSLRIMAVSEHTHTGLNELQVSLLRLFNRPMSEEEIKKLKRLLVQHYSAQLKEEVTKTVSEKGYTQKDFDDMLNSDS